MKKIFTLIAGILFAAAVMAADRRPVVTLHSARNYKVVIDGRSYFGSDMTINLNHFNGGRHTIKVFEMKRGFLVRGERLVGSSVFQVGRNDLAIRIDRFGTISIREKKNYRGFNDDNDWNDRNDRDPWDNQRDDRNNRF